MGAVPKRNPVTNALLGRVKEAVSRKKALTEPRPTNVKSLDDLPSSGWAEGWVEGWKPSTEGWVGGWKPGDDWNASADTSKSDTCWKAANAVLPPKNLTVGKTKIAWNPAVGGFQNLLKMAESQKSSASAPSNPPC